MKPERCNEADIHPKYEETTVTAAAATSSHAQHQENIAVEICSACHPFFTGKMKYVDTTGRVEKFTKKYKLGQSRQEGRGQASRRSQIARQPCEAKGSHALPFAFFIW